MQKNYCAIPSSRYSVILSNPLPPETAGLSPLLHSFVLHITCPAFIFPQLLNLTGSLLFAATLGSGKLSIAVPLANGVSLAGTAVVDHFLGDGVPLWPGLPGVALIIAGVVLCTQSATA